MLYQNHSSSIKKSFYNLKKCCIIIEKVRALTMYQEAHVSSATTEKVQTILYSELLIMLMSPSELSITKPINEKSKKIKYRVIHLSTTNYSATFLLTAPPTSNHNSYLKTHTSLVQSAQVIFTKIYLSKIIQSLCGELFLKMTPLNLNMETTFGLHEKVTLILISQ